MSKTVFFHCGFDEDKVWCQFCRREDGSMYRMYHSRNSPSGVVELLMVDGWGGMAIVIPELIAEIRRQGMLTPETAELIINLRHLADAASTRAK